MEQLKSLLTILAPILLPVVSGGTFLAILLARLKRRDEVADRELEDTKDTEHERKAYEIAYRECNAHGVRMAIVIIPAITACMTGKPEDAMAYLRIMGEYLGSTKEGVWIANEPPDFIGNAKAEIEKTERERIRIVEATK